MFSTWKPVPDRTLESGRSQFKLAVVADIIVFDKGLLLTSDVEKFPGESIRCPETVTRALEQADTGA